ncbi:RodZ domain-containing protein [Spiribacter halobius]|uniref:Cytoskeleton protein RodZ-like C-terminal domain-containing protein n=1 Tax=Sediminicurvatus halobius TaxID=2182432 RepID=A0A2U2N511_9GAMM|nr:RodZ domain-containing protein [Spiribacter halobius]PWG64059.1 hypothetical protein DEM34_06040 [Spiribacter halobius]UEX76886.1 DUF4115 domain-containing protein [Spiribacter halobius]
MADSEPQVGETASARPRQGPGRLLRDQRLRRELSVGDVADGLHLDARTIDALERDDYAGLPPVTFVRGYLRAYARLLELPDDEVLKRFDAMGVSDGTRPLTPSVGDAGTAPAPTPAVRRRSGGLFAVSLALVLVIGGVGGGAWLLQQRDWSLPGLDRLLGSGPATESADGDGNLALAPEASDSTADADAAPDPRTDGSTAAEPETGISSESAREPPPVDGNTAASGRTAEQPVFDPELVEPPAAGDSDNADANAPEASDGGGLSPAPEELADDEAAGPDTTAPEAPAAEPRLGDAAPPAEAMPRRRAGDDSAATAGTSGGDAPADSGAAPVEPDSLLAGEADEGTTRPGAGADGTEAPADGQGGDTQGAPAAEDQETLRFSFSGESWMEVRDARGERLLFGLEEGGVREVAGVPPFEIVVGDTQNVSLEREGESVPLEQYARDRVARFTLGSP